MLYFFMSNFAETNFKTSVQNSTENKNIGLQLLFKNRYDLNQIILENSEVIRNWPLLGSPKKKPQLPFGI